MSGGRAWGTAALVVLLWTSSPGMAKANPAETASSPHLVARGETLWQIARAHGVSVETIASANRLADPARLQVGQSLRLSSSASTTVGQARPARRQPAAPDRGLAEYRVRADDTLWTLAQQHGTTVGVLLRLNRLREHAVLRPGQRLQVPGQTRGIPAVAPRGGGDATATIRRRTAPALQWPSRGAVTSRFGLRHRRLHAGIDIALAPRTPVAVVRDGIISFAGSLGAYGLLVVVNHGGGLTTRYGHLASISGRVGQRVAAGETIGAAGRSGNATGWILHFEVRRDGRPMNPLPMLGQGSSE